MSAPIKRLAPRCLSYRPKTIASHARLAQIRAASSSNNDDGKGSASQPNPVLDEYVRKNPQALKATNRTPSERERLAMQTRMVRPGELPATSIFGDNEALSDTNTPAVPSEDLADRAFAHMDVVGRNLVLDPDPGSRERWERKQIIKAIRKGGRMTRKQMIKRTEREHLAKSHNIKTSVKKLMMLARQIAGKPLDEAIEQMRFSKKKAAESVHNHLLAAKDEAVVIKGMALGRVDPDKRQPKPTMIRTKDGKKYTVEDPTKLYIDQAWVGRGPYGKLPDYRARGRMFIMRTPWTSLTVVLKEDATRIREYNDREEKRRKQRLIKLWTHLPDKALIGPRGQYYSW